MTWSDLAGSCFVSQSGGMITCAPLRYPWHWPQTVIAAWIAISLIATWLNTAKACRASSAVMLGSWLITGSVYVGIAYTLHRGGFW